MFKRNSRLPAAVKLIKSKIIVAPLLTTKIAANNLSHNRYGVIISKKVAKLAVDRNRSKRIVRSVIEQENNNLKTGHDYLFIIRRNLKEVPRTEIEKTIKEMLTMEGFFNEKNISNSN